MIEPFGPSQETWHFARATSWLTNFFAGKQGQSRPVKAAEIFSELDSDNLLNAQEQKEQTPDQMKAIMRAWQFALEGG